MPHMRKDREERMGEVPALDQIEAWLDAGQALQVQPWLDALCAADDVPMQLAAARALRHLGDERGGDARALRLARRHPTQGAAQVASLRTVLGNRGAYAYWVAAQRWPVPDEGHPAWRAERLSLQGQWLAELRDAGPALALQEEALRLWPDDPWLWVEHSYTLARLDQADAAADAARQALRVRPGYRTAAQQVALLAWQAGRSDDARAVLEPLLAATGSGSVAWQLFGMASDEQRHSDALALLDQVQAGMPLAGARWANALAARRADCLLHLGDLAGARVQAERVTGPGFYARLAQTLAAPDATPRRVLLAVPPVKQHWMTCAPATLTALANFFGREARHLEVAQAICYDGTSAASERAWAVEQGFWVREFKLDWPTTCSLLDAGLPFALATHYVASGHLQAVVGYDRLRRTVLIRDPSLPLHVEYEAEQLFDAQQSSGPRAMLMLPPEASARAEGIELPEARQWDEAHALQAALQRHDRAAAVEALDRLQTLAPGSDSWLRSQRLLAIYDGDEPRILQATEALLERYPHDPHLLLSRLASLVEVKGQAAAEAHLQALVEQERPDALTLCRWASQLAQDARRLPQALQAVQRALRMEGSNARAWSELADRLWQQQGAAAALQPLRWASTLQPTQEWAAGTYARGCRVAGDPEQGLAWLCERERIWGDRASAPAITWADELDALQRSHEADAVLDAALVRRPADAALRLHLAERRLRHHRLDDAESLLEGCVDAHRPALLRMRSLLLEARGALDDALAAVREAVALEPLQLAHHRLLLRQLKRRFGEAEALAQWRPLTDAHPAHVGLQKLLYDALPDQAEAINRQLDLMHAYHPGHAWLQRERAVQAARQERLDDAVALAETAMALAPGLAVSHNVLAFCHASRGGYAEALPHLQACLRLDAEFEPAVERLLAAPTPQQAREGVDFLAAEMRRQVLLGDGLLTLQTEAGQGWTAEEVLALLQELAAQWPGLWQGPVAVARQLQRVQRTEEALTLLAQACERFPQLPRVHLEHALALQQLHRPQDAMKACATALALSPSWNRAVRLQVDLLGDHGRDWGEAVRVLERALDDRHGWDDADLVGLLGWVHEQQRQDEPAWEHARRSLLMEPRPSWVWSLARRICERREDLAGFDALIADVVASRPGDVDAWAVQATRARDDERALEAAARALALVPRYPAVWQARFERLLRLGRHSEIEQALQALPWPAPAPVSLRMWSARLAWERGERTQALQLIQALRDEAPRDEDLCVGQADWLDVHEDHAGYLQAAQDLVAMAPLDARSHGYLGHALVKNERGQDALAPLQQALKLAPNYLFAARQLVAAARQAQVHALAEPALQMLWPHHPTVATACDGIEMAALAGHQDVAQVWLERLFGLDDFEIERCRAALAAWHEAGWGEALRVQQEQHVAQGGGPAGVALDWLVRQEDRSFTLALVQAWRWQRQAKGPHLLRALLRWLKDTDSRFAVRAVIHRFGAALRADDEAWGETSYVLSSMSEHRAVVRWLHDWRERARPPVYAMGNLAGSLAILGRWTELRDVVQATLKRSPYNEDMRLWELVLHLHHGEQEGLAAAMARCHEWKPDAWMKPALDALQAYLGVVRREPAALVSLRRALPDGRVRQAQVIRDELVRQAHARHMTWWERCRWWLSV
jgi:tetratricopeptide (TPR) repeat protein